MANPVLKFPVANKLDVAVSKLISGVPMAEEDQHQLVKELLAGLQEKTEQQVQGRVHPLVYANLAFIVGLVFWIGVTWQRVNTIEDSARKVSQVDSLVTEVGNMKTELHDLTTRLDRYLDNERPARQ